MDTSRAVIRAHLDALAAALRPTGLTAHPHYGQDPPFLHVTNPALTGPAALPSPLLNERVTARRTPEGRWLLLWSWGEPIAPATDLATAVAKLRHVLAPGGLQPAAIAVPAPVQAPAPCPHP